MDAGRHFTSVLCPVPDCTELTEEESRLFSRLNKWLDFPIGHLSRAMWPEDKLKMATEGTPIADFF